MRRIHAQLLSCTHQIGDQVKTCMVIIQCQRDKLLHCETFVGRRPGPESAGAHHSMQQHAASFAAVFCCLDTFHPQQRSPWGIFLAPVSGLLPARLMEAQAHCAQHPLQREGMRPQTSIKEPCLCYMSAHRCLSACQCMSET